MDGAGCHGENCLSILELFCLKGKKLKLLGNIAVG